MTDTFSPGTVMEGPGEVRPVSYGNDGNFVVEFYTREVVDPEATKIQGRTILKPAAYCRKYAVGDPRTVWDAPASDVDKHRWPQHWAAFEKGEKDSVIGTPLDAWPLLNVDMQFALKNAGFKTVEQIVAVTDGNLSTMPGNVGQLIMRVKAHAEKFIKDQEAGEAERRLQGELEERDNAIAAMKAQMEAMAQQMASMRDAQLSAPIQEPVHEMSAPLPAPPKEPEAPGLEALEALPELEPVAEPVTAPLRYTVKRGYHCFQVLDPAGVLVSEHKTKAIAEKVAADHNKAA